MSETHDLPALSANGRRLIQKLAELPRGWLTAVALAEAIGVSRRTVLRELPGVERWMTAAGFRFLRSPGQGLLLDEEDRAPLLSLLNTGTRAALPREERRKRLLLSLLAAREPRKTYALAREAGASEHALASDLLWVEEWLRPYAVRLCRRPGVGVWLEGTPEKRRRAVSALLRVYLPEQEAQLGKPLSLPGLLSPETADKVWSLLRAFEQEEGMYFTDAGFLSLAIHCALTVEQIRAGGWAPSPVEKAVPLEYAARLAGKLEKAFALSLPSEEVRYLALYLDAYSGLSDEDDWGSAGELELRDLSMRLIGSVGRTLGVDLSRYPSLSEDLCAHLRPMLYRMEQGVPAENPQLAVIQTEYAVLWQATRAACDEAQQALGLSPIPDEEAGFLAMHFGAILERESLARMRVRAMVVCPFGMASSKFLASQLIREFASLHITASGSARGLSPEGLHRQGIDLLISTVPLDIDFPHVCVNAILQEQDRARLRGALAKVQAGTAVPARAVQPADDLRYAGRFSAALLDLLAALRIETVSLPRTRMALITQAAKLFAADDPAPIEQAILRREAMGDTYIRPLWALLLHCKTNAVPGCRLGYLRAEPPVYEDGRMIRGALVLLAPETEDTVPTEVMQAVSGLLIEEPQLIQSLRAGDLDGAAEVLERGLGQRFRIALHKKWRE